MKKIMHIMWNHSGIWLVWLEQITISRWYPIQFESNKMWVVNLIFKQNSQVQSPNSDYTIPMFFQMNWSSRSIFNPLLDLNSNSLRSKMRNSKQLPNLSFRQKKTKSTSSHMKLLTSSNFRKQKEQTAQYSLLFPSSSIFSSAKH